jgi:hypothetical protein
MDTNTQVLAWDTMAADNMADTDGMRECVVDGVAMAVSGETEAATSSSTTTTNIDIEDDSEAAASITSTTTPINNIEEGSEGSSTKADTLSSTTSSNIEEGSKRSTPSAEDVSEARTPEFNEQVLRQVEHYFSDENILFDAHLIGKLREAKYGEGLISIDQITHFPRMRKYKPRSAVIDALEQSTIIEVVKRKYIRRRIPVDMATAEVEDKPLSAQERENQRILAVLEANPHLTRGMLKATGFERDFAEPARTQGEIDSDVADYDARRSVYNRLETAVLNFRSRRKFHQETASFFNCFLDYCGFRVSVPMFVGGCSKEEQEDWTPEQRRDAKKKDFIEGDVAESLSEEDGRWEVDIAKATKGFLSTRFPDKFEWTDPEIATSACNVLRNWYNYMLHHKVLAEEEFELQIRDAITAVNEVEAEFPKFALAQKLLPGAFGKACSILQGGEVANTCYIGDWMTPEDIANTPVLGYDKATASRIVSAGIVAYGNAGQIAYTKRCGGNFKTVKKEIQIGLEVTEILPLADAPQKAQILFASLKNSVVPPMGYLICKRYDFPNAALQDLGKNPPALQPVFRFLVDEETLQSCYKDMKIEADVSQLDVGFYWIDHVHHLHGSFYTWCWNEVIKDYKKPGPPKECKLAPI